MRTLRFLPCGHLTGGKNLGRSPGDFEVDWKGSLVVAFQTLVYTPHGLYVSICIIHHSYWSHKPTWYLQYAPHEYESSCLFQYRLQATLVPWVVPYGWFGQHGHRAPGGSHTYYKCSPLNVGKTILNHSPFHYRWVILKKYMKYKPLPNGWCWTYIVRNGDGNCTMWSLHMCSKDMINSASTLEAPFDNRFE